MSFGVDALCSVLPTAAPSVAWKGGGAGDEPGLFSFLRWLYLATRCALPLYPLRLCVAHSSSPVPLGPPFPSLIRATPLSRILTSLPIAAALAAMASKKVDETTTLKGTDDPDDKNLPEWVVKYGAPLAITFYILVAVVKTMLTKVRLGTSALAVTMRRAHGSLRAGPCSCLAGPLRGWRGVPCRLFRHLGRRHVPCSSRLPLRSHTVGSAQEGLPAW